MTAAGGFDPVAILDTLNRHRVRYVVVGGFAATAYGSPLPTTDVDVTPETSKENLTRLSEALSALEARIRVEGIPDGLPFSHSADSLAGSHVLNLLTRFGELDLILAPAGGNAYPELAARALTVDLHDVAVPLAALEDVIASKEAAGRPKDRQALPLLRVLLSRLAATGEGGAAPPDS
jgi:hypothetical protein